MTRLTLAMVIWLNAGPITFAITKALGALTGAW
jgi:hypothetical protein